MAHMSCFTLFFIHFGSCYLFRYTSLEDSSDLVSQKRSNASLICQENKKKRKVQKPEVLVVQITVELPMFLVCLAFGL